MSRYIWLKADEKQKNKCCLVHLKRLKGVRYERSWSTRMEINELMSSVECILFASGEAVPVSRLAEALDTNKSVITNACEMLCDRLTASKSGLRLVFLDDKCQLTTHKQYGDFVRKALDLRRNTPLSQASMEVLALIAYNQPVTKAFIEQIRGVDCSGIVTSLCEKKLVEEKGRLELPGRPLVFGTTSDFLRVFGISNLDELLPLPEDAVNDGTQLEGQSTLEDFIEIAEKPVNVLPLDEQEQEL